MMTLFPKVPLLKIGLTGHSHHKSPGLSCYTVHNIFFFWKGC